jgi:acylpyruvate hydrolase
LTNRRNWEVVSVRLVTYQSHSGERAGALSNRHIVDIQLAGQNFRDEIGLDDGSPLPSDLKSLIELQDGISAARKIAKWAGSLSTLERLEDAGVAVLAEGATLRPPVPAPGKIICLGRNYALHAEEGGVGLPEVPELFAKFANSLIGHDQPILIPSISDQIDYEGELAVVIGKRVKNLTQERALDSVLGYTILNDVSIRDYQLRTSQWLAGKTFDNMTPVGPWIVTADEIPDPQKLVLTLDVDGERLQSASTDAMIFSVAQTLAFISSFITLEPGDIISTGTPEGVGLARTPPRWLRAGETVNVTIDGIGTLSNPVDH